MKTFFFVIPKMGRANFILGTNIFQYLKKEGHRLVVFSPFNDNADFQKKYGGENVIFLPLVKANPGKITRASLHLRELLLTIYHPDLRKSVLILKSINAQKVLKFSPLEKFLSLGSKLIYPFRKIIGWKFNVWERLILRRANYIRAFEQYRPSAVILGTHGSDINDIVFLAHCRIKKVPSLVVDFPWSYLDNRIYAYPRPIDKYALWNEEWKRELMQIHKIPEKNLEVTSSARYDYYINEFKPDSRESFLQKIGADPNKKLITFATLSDVWHPFQPQVISFLLDSIRSGALPKNCQLRIRLAPGQDDPPRYLALLKKYPELMIEEADKIIDRNHLTNLLWHSNVVLAVGSSLATDACALDKPIIYIGVTDRLDNPYNAVLKMIYEQVFLQKAVETGGVSIAWGNKTLIDKINAYLQNPALDREKRKALIERFLGKIDGKAGTRIAKVVLSF